MTVNTDSFPQDFFGDLKLSRTILDVSYLSHNVPEGFTGSAWRGILGPGLRQVLCPYNKNKSCENDCLLQEQCPFFSLFHKGSELPGMNAAPRGYTLYSIPTGEVDRESLEITLFGDCHQFLLPITEIYQRTGNTGLTHKKCTFQITEKTTLHPAPSRESESHLLKEWLGSKKEISNRNYCFQIPVRLRRNKKYLRTMDWSFFFMTLVRRLEALNCIYNVGTPLGRETINDLQRTFQNWTNIRDRLKWQDLWRYSSTQKRKVPIGGLVGEIYVKECTSQQSAWFEAAALVGVGKAAVMGLGKITEIDNSSKQKILNNQGGK